MFKLTVVTDSGNIEISHQYAVDFNAHGRASQIATQGFFNHNADGEGGGSFWPAHRINLVEVEKVVDTS